MFRRSPSERSSIEEIKRNFLDVYFEFKQLPAQEAQNINYVERRKRMRKIYSIITLVAIALMSTMAIAFSGASLPKAPPAEVSMSGERLERIAQVLKKDIDASKLPGAVVMVARKGKLVYSSALGVQDKNTNVPMSGDSLFRIFSMTKPLVSVATMMLAEEGRIQLTDPVSRFLPAMKGMQVSVARPDATFGRMGFVMVPAEREMTIHDLLRHTSGLTYGERSGNVPVSTAYTKLGILLHPRDLTPTEFVERLGKTPLAQQPGTVWEYSLSTDVLGMVVESASGKRLGTFLEERLLKPLRMADTSFWVPKEKLTRVAQPFPIDPASGQQLHNPNQVFDVGVQPKLDSGGAGAISTASDYLHFCQMLLNGGVLDGIRILSRSSVQLMTADHLGQRIATPVSPGDASLQTPGYTFGLGFAVRQGNGLAGVPGSEGEYLWAGTAGTFFWVDPKEQIIGIYMTQAPGPSRNYYRRLIKQLVYQAVTD
jgi:CubicO group peptidase (beta-lactamase class C family)